MYLIREMPKEERPRERLIEYGVSALSNEELLAILLRTGRKDLSVLELSKNVLSLLIFAKCIKSFTYVCIRSIDKEFMTP